ncbi:MAG: hypothetical protein AMXMBFR13_29230 [Phycisphaerae bacterium]
METVNGNQRRASAGSRGGRARRQRRLKASTLRLAAIVDELPAKIVQYLERVFEELPSELVALPLDPTLGQRFNPTSAAIYRMLPLLCLLTGPEACAVEKALVRAITEDDLFTEARRFDLRYPALRLAIAEGTGRQWAPRPLRDEEEDDDSGYDGWLPDPSPRRR